VLCISGEYWHEKAVLEDALEEAPEEALEKALEEKRSQHEEAVQQGETNQSGTGFSDRE